MKRKGKVKMEHGSVGTGKKTVLVGTYRHGQLEQWPGYYNYPLTANDEFDIECAKKVNEIWLFQGTKGGRFYTAEFVGNFTRDELKAQFAYPAKGKGHGGRYLLYRIGDGEIYDPASGMVDAVIVRSADFATVPKVRHQIKVYLESQNRQDAEAAKFVPDILTRLPRDVLRVSETAVQMEFASLVGSAAFAPRTSDEKSTYRIASLFAGCGGMDLGFVGGFDFLGKKFDRTGFDIVWANELNPAACKTYARNLGNHIVCGDIKNVIDTIPAGVDVVMGGFPCQDISINGKMLGINGRRSCLYTYIVDAVRHLQPKVFIAENVGSLMLKQNEYSFKTILADFQSLGYDVTYHVYHAEEYGVPQTRERIIFVGTRPDIDHFEIPKPVSSDPITAGEALRDLEGRGPDKAFSHVWSMAAPSGEQGNRRMVENRPGYTIRAECHGNIQFHYRLPRRISMREAARIQSFPDSFVFPCGIRETERQIGNAVPPVLAWHIANSVKKILESSHVKG